MTTDTHGNQQFKSQELVASFLMTQQKIRWR